jgi:hypothetical protein
MKEQKVLSPVEEKEFKSLGRKADKLYDVFVGLSEGTKEKGDKLLEYYETKKAQYKIKSTFSDRMSLDVVKKLYYAGLTMRKWKK